MAFQDVRDAWRSYASNENRGRGVVLIGHSQGTGWLVDLLRQEIEGTPAQNDSFSALLIGGDVLVPTARTLADR